ncbi:hypothetical protein [Agrobacterium tumefaciens]|uniref:hypothetical protein n=1 Tax=Agrobacterium tumefaciens TaxID=358 RepID=UPI00287C8F60|nr:hypothetical protein [Agrobacterium tumefaciens]MDS7594968.1 hypothetical protein [Agrobacterium tumefaciens]
MTDMTHVYEQHERRQDPNVHRHEEMRLGTIWESLVKSPSDQLRQADRLEPLKLKEEKVAASWRVKVGEDAERRDRHRCRCSPSTFRRKGTANAERWSLTLPTHFQPFVPGLRLATSIRFSNPSIPE